MNKIKKFLKYVIISTIASNIPWIVYGTLFGWPSILLISIILVLIDGLISSYNKLEVLFLTFWIGVVSNLVGFVVLGLLYKADPPLILIFYALPSIFIGSGLVACFHKKQQGCICPIHKI